MAMAEVGALITDDLAVERTFPHPILVRPERDETEDDQTAVPGAVRVETTRPAANSLPTSSDTEAEVLVEIESLPIVPPPVNDDAIVIEPALAEESINVSRVAPSVAVVVNALANQPVTDVRALQGIVNETIPEIAVPVVPAPQVPLTEATLVPVIVAPATGIPLDVTPARALPVTQDQVNDEAGRLDPDVIALEGLENEQEEAERNGEQVAPPDRAAIEAEDAEIALLTQAIPLPSDRLIADIPLSERYALAAGASRETLRPPATLQNVVVPAATLAEANERIESDSARASASTVPAAQTDIALNNIASLEAQFSVNATPGSEEVAEPVASTSADVFAAHSATTALASQIAGSVLATNVRPDSVEVSLSPESDAVKALSGVMALSTANPDVQHHLQNQNSQVGSRHGEAAKLRHQRQLASLEHIDLYV